MNKSISLLFSVLFLGTSFSQRNVVFTGFYTFNHPMVFNENNELLKTFRLDNGHGAEEQKDIHYRSLNKIKTTTISSPNLKQEKHFTFNENGRIQGFELVIKGELRNAITIEYTNDSLFSKVIDLDRKGNSMEYVYSYNADNFITMSEILINGELKLKRAVTYTGDNNVSKDHKVIYKRKKQMNLVTENEYYENGDLKKTTLSKDGKIIRVYEYECKPEGVEVKASKTTSDVCVWKDERNDGSYTRYVRTQSKKSVYLNSYTFDKDSVLVDAKTFLDEDKKISHQIYGKHYTTTQYFRKNKLNFSQTTTFDDNKRVASIVKTNPNKLFGKKATLSYYNYTPKGLVSSISMNQNHKKEITVDFSYEFF
jgi:hypothetical protein